MTARPPEACQCCGRADAPTCWLQVEPAAKGAPWRQAATCMACLEGPLDADLWISEACWARARAAVPFADLPILPAPAA